MKKLTIILLLLIPCSVLAQKIDDERMNRDLEIAKNVLGTLLKGESDRYWGSSSINGNYVDGYGVIFTIPRHYPFIHLSPPNQVVIPRVRVRTRGTGDNVIIYEEQIKAYAEEAEEIANKQEQLLKKQEELIEKQNELSKEEQKELQEAMIDIELNSEEIAKIAEEAEAQVIQWKEDYQENLEASMQHSEQAIITFLADYADLIGQLKPTDHILVKQESPFDEEFYIAGWENGDAWVDVHTDVEEDTDEDLPEGTSGISSSGKKGSGFSAEVSKKVISDYKTGKINFDTFKEKVIIKHAELAKKSPDLDMFASIFRQYYGPKMSKTFFTERTPSYEILDNFGVIYNISTYSSYIEGKYYYMPVIGKDKVSSGERKEKIEELYPQFESDLKSFIIDYGRTIRSLEDDDMLLLKIKMTKCEECSIPKSIDVSVKMSVLKQFDQQKLSRDKAMAAIEIKKNFNSKNF